MADPGLLSLDGRVAVITGAGGGIGRVVVEAFAAAGASIVANDQGVTLEGRKPSARAAEEIAAAVRARGGRAVAHTGSVADFDNARALIDLALRRFGRVDVLFTAHGILRERMIFNMTEDEWDSVVDVHLKGTFNCLRFASAAMRQQRSGTILLVSSAAGLEGSPAQANYSAAKAGIVGLTLSTALAMGRYGVSVNCVVPAAATRMTDRINERTAGSRPASERASAEIVGALAVALSADPARHITGQIYTAAGDKLARWSLPAEVTFVRRETWSPSEVLAAVSGELGSEPLRRFASLGLAEPEAIA